jgi:hypothetical protein
MTALLIAAGFALATIAFLLLARAARPAPASEEDARTTFSSFLGFDPGEVHSHMGNAISYDPVRNCIAIWDKPGGPRLVDPSGVNAWTASSRLGLFSKADDRRPFFSVAVISDTERAAWRDRMQAVFGGEKEVKG